MKIMKKLSLLLAIVLAVTALTACSEKEVTEVTDTSKANDVWELDLKNHWHLTKSGDKTDVAEHQLDEDGFCTVCNYEIIDYEDGTYDINAYDSHGNVIHSEYHDEDGTVYVTDYDYEYDTNGNVNKEYIFTDGVLETERTYAIGKNGESTVGEEIYYYGNDMCQFKYNEYGDILTETYYMGDDVDHVISHEYAYDGDGNKTEYRAYNGQFLYEEHELLYSEDKNYTYSAKTHEYSIDGSKVTYAYDENYNLLSVSQYDTDEILTDEVVYEYTFDSDGHIVYTKIYENGVLCEEAEGAYDENGYVYDAKVTVYNEDGTVSITEYDAEWNILSDTTYDADGNVISLND